MPTERGARQFAAERSAGYAPRSRRNANGRQCGGNFGSGIDESTDNDSVELRWVRFGKHRRVNSCERQGFMRREYKMLGIFSTVLVVVLFIFLGWKTAFAFVVGAAASAVAGYIGMNTATRANVRTTVAAHSSGPAEALTIAFFGGSIMGLAVASLGLLGLRTLYLLFAGDPETAHAIHGFWMGASSVALFSRVGGGIYTKSADVGADLVGKVEAGIPEDDPRNPGVIAHNVGDSVGDVAGMGSDIFESYCGAMSHDRDHRDGRYHGDGRHRSNRRTSSAHVPATGAGIHRAALLRCGDLAGTCLLRSVT
jgi:hypothetical protein